MKSSGRKPGVFIALGLFVMLLGGCNDTPNFLESALMPQGDEHTTRIVDDDVAQIEQCWFDAADAAIYINPRDGYCLGVPYGYSVRQPAQGVLEVSGPALDSHPFEPLRAYMTISTTHVITGLGVEEVAEKSWESARGEFVQHESTLDAEKAMIAEDLFIGEASWQVQQVIVMKDDTVFFLTFSPTDDSEQLAKAQPDVAKLWDTVMVSFRFLR